MSQARSADIFTADELKSFFERWQRLQEAKAAISENLKGLFAEAKAKGYDPKVLRNVFRDKTEDQTRRSEVQATYDLYWVALDTSVAAGADTAQPEPATLAPATTDTPEEVAVTQEMSHSKSVQTDREVSPTRTTLGTSVATPAGRARPARTSPTLTAPTVAVSEDDPSQAEDPAPDAVLGGLDGAKSGTELGAPGPARGHPAQAEPVSPPPPTAMESPVDKAVKPEESSSDAIMEVPGDLSRGTLGLAVTGSGVHADSSEGTTPAKRLPTVDKESLSPSSSFIGPVDIRPYCRNRRMCAGTGRKHCNSCERAHEARIKVDVDQVGKAPPGSTSSAK